MIEKFMKYFAYLNLLIYIVIGCIKEPNKPMNNEIIKFEVVNKEYPSEFDSSFNKAENILYKLLLPNSMTRTTPRTKAEINSLIDEFYSIITIYRNDTNLSIEYLKHKLNLTTTENESPGYTALEILFLIGNEKALSTIKEAQNLPNEVDVNFAKELINEKTDVFIRLRN